MHRTPEQLAQQRERVLRRQHELLRRLNQQDQRYVYGGLLWIRDLQGWKSGWERHAFREIFHCHPQEFPDAAIERPISTDLEEWVYRRRQVGAIAHAARGKPYQGFLAEPEDIDN